MATATSDHCVTPPACSLNIAVVTETFPPEINGVANTAARFVDGLVRRGHSLRIVRPSQHADDRPRFATGRTETLVPSLAIPRYPQLKMGMPARRRLQRAWTEWRPDLVHVVTEGPLGWSATRAANALDLPVVVDFRTNFHLYSQHYGIGWLERPILAVQRALHARTQATLVPTPAMRDLLAGHGFSNLHVVGRGVDAQLFDPARRSNALRESWGAGADTAVVLYVGRLAAEKNLALLTTAFETLRKQQPDTRLVFVGDGPHAARLRATCPDAIYAGERRGEELACHYASADLFAFPSLTETFGNVTLEAMASGLPVLACSLAAAAALIEHNVNGLLVAPGDSTAFIAQMLEAVASPTRLRRQGIQARRTAQSLSWPAVVARQEAVFIKAIAARRARPQIDSAWGASRHAMFDDL